MGLRNTTELVKYILENDKRARNSDSFLYLKVLEEIDNERGTDILRMKVMHFLSDQAELDIPSIETVGRCRRKVVESNPHLAGNSEVEVGRALKETEFREYARQVMV